MRGLATVLTIGFAFNCRAFAGEIEFLPPARISGAAQGGFPGHAVATNGAQTWVLVSEAGQQIVTSRSTDGAASWSAPVQLRSDATGERSTLASDGTTWLAVWDSLTDGIVASRSLDGGVTWSTPEPLDSANPSAENPVVVTGNGVWCVVWVRHQSGDRDLIFSRSLDGGVSWSTPALLNSDGATDTTSDWDRMPALGTDGAGSWIAAWVYSRVSGAEHNEIRVARSVDDATTWSSPAGLDTNELTAGTEVQFPSVATDGSAWVVAWNSIDIEGGPPALLGDDLDLLSVRSTDAGVTWSAPAVLNVDAATDKGDDYGVRINTDGANTWLAVWGSMNTLGNTLDTDGDILVAWSSDGETWSAPEPVNRDAAGDRNVDEQRYDDLPLVVAGGTGTWVTVWRQFLTGFGAPLGDVLIARGPTPKCASVALASCLQASKATLRVNEIVVGKESLKATMGLFDAPLSLNDLGDPIAGESVYQVCFYDQNGALAGGMVVPRAGGICGNNFKPCWQLARGTALNYGDGNGWSGGVRRLKVQTGSQSEAKVVVKGKNKTRQFPVGLAAALAGNTLATLQLAIDDGVCLEATLGSVTIADGATFAATLP